MPSKRIVLTSLALTGLLCGAAGCSSAESGTPVAGGSAVSTPTDRESTTAQPTSSQAPTESQAPSADRPKPIDLTAVDLCQVLAGMPLRDFELDGDRPPLAGESSLFPGAKDCFANGRQNNVSLLLVGVTDQGAREFAEFASVAAKSDVVAAGYPLTVLTPQAPSSCLGVLDVDDGQMLYISYGLASPREQPVTPQAQLCRTVPAIASAAVAAIG